MPSSIGLVEDQPHYAQPIGASLLKIDHWELSMGVRGRAYRLRTTEDGGAGWANSPRTTEDESWANLAEIVTDCAVGKPPK
jgi:hypothetical protein